MDAVALVADGASAVVLRIARVARRVLTLTAAAENSLTTSCAVSAASQSRGYALCQAHCSRKWWLLQRRRRWR